MIQQLRVPLKLRATPQRRGAIVVVVVFAAIAVCCLAALAINVAYIELTKTEMRMATDAAAKASITTLGHTQNLDLAPNPPSLSPCGTKWPIFHSASPEKT